MSQSILTGWWLMAHGSWFKAHGPWLQEVSWPMTLRGCLQRVFSNKCFCLLQVRHLSFWINFAVPDYEQFRIFIYLYVAGRVQNLCAQFPVIEGVRRGTPPHCFNTLPLLCPPRTASHCILHLLSFCERPWKNRAWVRGVRRSTSNDT